MSRFWLNTSLKDLYSLAPIISDKPLLEIVQISFYLMHESERAKNICYLYGIDLLQKQMNWF